MNNAYAKGFCKMAEAYGVDPDKLIKVAWSIGMQIDPGYAEAQRIKAMQAYPELMQPAKTATKPSSAPSDTSWMAKLLGLGGVQKLINGIGSKAPAANKSVLAPKQKTPNAIRTPKVPAAAGKPSVFPRSIADLKKDLGNGRAIYSK